MAIINDSFSPLDSLMQRVEEKTVQEKKESTLTTTEKQNGPLKDKSEVQNIRRHCELACVLY
jgi:hypothetical protein